MFNVKHVAGSNFVNGSSSNVKRELKRLGKLKNGNCGGVLLKIQTVCNENCYVGLCFLKDKRAMVFFWYTLNIIEQRIRPEVVVDSEIDIG